MAVPSPQFLPGTEMSVEAHGGSAAGSPNFVSQSGEVRIQGACPKPELGHQLTEPRQS